MPNLHRLYQARHATIVHAAGERPIASARISMGRTFSRAASPRPGAIDTGWLNRALLALASDGRVDPRGGRAVAVGPVTPLVVRGQAPVMSWAPQQMLPASDDTQARLLDLVSGHRSEAGGGARGAHAPGGARPRGRHGRQGGRRPTSAARDRARARLLRRGRRRRLPAISPGRMALASARWASSAGTRTSTKAPRRGSWPGCSGRSTARWRRSRPTWASSWRETVVAVITEFGRTARIERHRRHGPRHGHGRAAGRRRAAGRTRGRRLARTESGSDLDEDRDLKATIDLRAVLEGPAQGPTCGSTSARSRAACFRAVRHQADRRPGRPDVADPANDSIRVNAQWRVCFVWKDGHAYDVEIVDYH